MVWMWFPSSPVYGIQEETESRWVSHCSPRWGYLQDTKWRYPQLRLSPHPAPLVSGLCGSYWGEGICERWGAGGRGSESMQATLGGGSLQTQACVEHEAEP